MLTSSDQDSSNTHSANSASSASPSSRTFSSNNSLKSSGDSATSSASSSNTSSNQHKVKVCTKKIFLENLEWNVHENLLKNFFKKFGTIKRCKVIRDAETNKSKGYGYIEFEKEKEAQALMVAKPADLVLSERTLKISYYKEKIKPKPRGCFTSESIECRDKDRDKEEPNKQNEIVNALPYNVLAKIFSYLCLRDRCIAEQGEKSLFFYHVGI